MRWLIVVALAGCNSLLGVHDFSSTDAAGSDDVTVDASTHVPCSLISMLANDFAAASDLWSYENAPTGVKFEYGLGELHITVPGGEEVTFHAFDFYDLTEGQFSILTGGMELDGVVVDLSIVGEVPGNRAAFHRNGTMLEFTRTLGGITTTLGSVMYSQYIQRHLRFREVGNQLFFESSADGGGYQVLAMTEATGLGFVQVNLLVHNGSTGSYVETVDDANGGTPSGAACPIAELADTFDSGSLEKWAHQMFEATGKISIEGGAVRLTPGMMGGGAGMLSSTVYDARDAGFELEVKEMLDTTTQATVFAVLMLGDDFTAEFYVAEGKVSFEIGTGTASTTTISTVPYDATTMRWLRFRTGQATISWEVSADGTTWMETANADAPTGLEKVRIYIAAIALVANTTSALVDNARIP